MKSGIHPQVYDVVYVDGSTGAQFITKSTTKSDKTVKIGGKEYYEMRSEITSDSHPFYTGKQTLIDTAGRVDKFRAKWDKAADFRKDGNAEQEETKADEKAESKEEAAE